MSHNLKAAILIPARFKSSRFEGKPLAKIMGEPMILRVCRLCAKVSGSEDVYVATDDARIQQVVKDGGFKVVMTSPSHQTGTDRIAEAAERIDADIFINVQGDEPLIDPEDIVRILDEKVRFPNSVIKGYRRIPSDENPENRNIVKVVFTEAKKMVYMSRSCIPGMKSLSDTGHEYHKAVCIYAFNKQELRAYADYGRKSALEAVEDIEILRFLDLGIEVKLVETKSESYAVDEPSDIGKVEKYIAKFN